MRSAPRSAAALLATALLALPGALRAQLTASAPTGPRVGILAGLSSATVGGSDATLDAGDGLEKKRRNGVVAGAYLVLPIAGLPLAVRPELLYAQKGVRATVGTNAISDVIGTGATGTAELATKLDYLELPVLLQLNVPTTAGLRPALYLGPSVAYQVRCRVELSYAGATESMSCDNTGDPTASAPRKVDVSGVVGGQLAFALGGRAVGAGVRYTLGLTKVYKDADVKNRALGVYGTIEFGR